MFDFGIGYLFGMMMSSKNKPEKEVKYKPKSRPQHIVIPEGVKAYIVSGDNSLEIYTGDGLNRKKILERYWR